MKPFITLLFASIALCVAHIQVNACDLDPTAVITLYPDDTVFFAGEQVFFNGYNSTANCGYISNYRWQFDGVTVNTSALYGPSFSLQSGQDSKTVDVQLRVQNSVGNYGYETVTITIVREHSSNYYLTDHLGSVRVTVDDDGNSIGWDDYYPFGLQMPGRTQNASNPNDDAKFTGYLLEQDGDLGIYHAEARMFDPVIGRFMQIDPLADDPMQVHLTPYNYAWNNPVNLNDPDGECPMCLGAILGGTIELASQIAINMNNGDSFSQAFGNVDVYDVGIAAGAGAATGGLSTLKSIGTVAKTGIAVATSTGEGAAKANLGEQTQDHGISEVARDAVLGFAGSAGSELGSRLAARTNTAQSLQKNAAVLERRAGKKAGNLNTTKGAAAAKAQRKAGNFVARGGVVARSATKATGNGVLRFTGSNNSQSGQLNTGASGIFSPDKTRVVVPFRR